MQPRPESRIESLEKRASTIEATLIELSHDTAEELKAIRQDNKAILQRMNEGFGQAHAYIKQEVETRLDRIETTLSEHGNLLQQILDRLPPKP